MDVLKHYNQTRFMEYVPKIRTDIGAWFIVEITLTGQAPHNAALVAMKMRDHFADKDGIIFICSEKELLVLVHMTKETQPDSISTGINEKLPRHSFSARATDVTPEGLVKIQIQLGEAEKQSQTSASGAALLAARQARRENIVMIIDDDALIRALVGHTFMNRARLLEHKDTIGALESYLEQLPDLVFLDIHMPGGSGLNLLEDILRFDETAHVLLLSNDSVKDNVLEARRLGARGFLAKPFTLEKLLDCYSRCPTITAA